MSFSSYKRISGTPIVARSGQLPRTAVNQTGPKVASASHADERAADSAASEFARSSSSRVKVPRAASGAVTDRDTAAPASVASAVSAGADAGRELPAPTRTRFEQRFDHNFSKVRVHADARAGRATKQIGASAFTHGNDVFLSPQQYRPGTASADKLLAHELAHVVQQSGASDAQRIHCRVAPEDVAVEMVGQTFVLSEDFPDKVTPLKAGDIVEAKAWNNKSETVSVVRKGAKGGAQIAVPKRILRPASNAVAGVAPYSAGVDDQAKVVSKFEEELAEWDAKKSQYKTEDQQKKFNAERARRAGLREARLAYLNRKLIQQTMYNRFDPIIAREVADANKAHGLKGAEALNPNLVKAMLFQESELGTSGENLELPPTGDFRKTRFNVGQVVDSSGLALLTLLEREHPHIVTRLVPSMRTDLQQAQNDLAELKAKSKRTAAEQAQLARLEPLSAKHWEVYIWAYQAPQPPHRFFADVVKDFFATGSPAKLNEDYQFWIHTAVFWLFEKKRRGMSWPEAINAFNGGGKGYRASIVKRAEQAEKAHSAGKPYEPKRK